MEKISKEILEEKIEYLNAQINESGIYIKISLVTLLFIFISFFTEKSFVNYLNNNIFLAFTIVGVLAILVLVTVYLLFNMLIFMKQKGKKLVIDKKNQNRNWLN